MNLFKHLILLSVANNFRHKIYLYLIICLIGCNSSKQDNKSLEVQIVDCNNWPVRPEMMLINAENSQINSVVFLRSISRNICILHDTMATTFQDEGEKLRYISFDSNECDVKNLVGIEINADSNKLYRFEIDSINFVYNRYRYGNIDMHKCEMASYLVNGDKVYSAILELDFKKAKH